MEYALAIGMILFGQFPTILCTIVGWEIFKAIFLGSN